MIERKLGRGLDFLIGDGQDLPEEEIRQVETDAIRPNPFQPRREFDPEALEELAESIRQNGILQPILLRQVEGEFEIVAGERRWRAASSLGLETIPAVVKTVEDERMLELALVENIQREDLNPMERARAYSNFLKELGLTQEKAAERLGKDRSTIANTIRLLDLPDEVQLLVSRGTISMGHARALLGLEDDGMQVSVARTAAEEGLSVRAVESMVRSLTARAPRRKQPAAASAHFADLEGRLRERLGTRVKIQDRGGRGKLVVEYYSREDFDRILEILEG